MIIFVQNLLNFQIYGYKFTFILSFNIFYKIIIKNIHYLKSNKIIQFQKSSNY